MKNDHYDIELSVARVMANNFKEDPLIKETQFEVIKKNELLNAHSLIQTKHALNEGNLHLLDNNPKAFLIGVDSLNESKFKEFILNFKICIKTIRTLNLKDFRKIISNNKKVSKVLNLSWHKKLIKNRYYKVKIIAIDKELRGTGAFRRLITPIIDFCNAEGIPLVLETHNDNNVGLYNHFGFELIKTITSSDTHIKQFCMIKWPENIKN